jgi:hypothetical protein
MTEVTFKGDGERLPKRSLVDTVNDRLRVNNTEENEATVQSVAKRINLDTKFLYQWADDDPILREQLEGFKNAVDVGLYDERTGLGNRADSHDLAEILLRAKKRHGV